MNKLLVSLLVVVVLAAGGVVALTMSSRDQAVREHEESKLQLAKAKEKEKVLEASLAAAHKEREQMRTDLRQAEQKISTLTAEVASAKAQATSSPGGSAGRGRAVAGSGIGSPSSTKPMNALADMMKNPAMREMIKQQQIAQLDMQYAGLMSHFQLNDEEKANFKQLLAERLQLDSDLGIKLMDSSLTAEQRKELVQQLSDSKAANDERIKTFLNSDDDYKTYKNWEDTKAERMQLSMGKSLFDSAGEPLSAQQEQDLVNIMANVRRQPKNMPDMSKPENFDPSKLTQEGIDMLLANSDRDAQQIVQEAGKMLSPKQIKALQDMLKQWRAMQEAGLKMSGAMMGGKK